MREPEGGIKLYCKGADIVILERLQKDFPYQERIEGALEVSWNCYWTSLGCTIQFIWLPDVVSHVYIVPFRITCGVFSTLVDKRCSAHFLCRPLKPSVISNFAMSWCHTHLCFSRIWWFSGCNEKSSFEVILNVFIHYDKRTPHCQY